MDRKWGTTALHVSMLCWCAADMVLYVIVVFPSFIALKLDARNILNVLHDPEIDFVDADWQRLGQQLLRVSQLRNIEANRRGDSSLCLMDTVSTWLQTDVKASWKRLAEAIEKVDTYGQKTATTVQQKAGIGQSRVQPDASEETEQDELHQRMRSLKDGK